VTVRTGHDAGAAARAWIGRDAYHLMCKAFVRGEVFNVVPSTSGTAIECWREAQHKHVTQDPESIPAFVPVFMDTSAAAEHVLVTVGRDTAGHRLAVTTDGGPGHTIALVRLATLAASWGPILGWSEDFDGQRVWTPPAPLPVVELEHIIDTVRRQHGEYRAEGRIVERALAAEGLLDQKWVDGWMGARTRTAYAAWQKRLGYTGASANGVPGRDSLTRLGHAHGFRVT
jgi:hypothetical protein